MRVRFQTTLLTVLLFLVYLLVAGVGPVLADNGGSAAPTLQSSTNLLSNPGAQTGDLTDWTKGGPSDPGPSVDNGTYDSGIDPRSGSYDFFGSDNTNDSSFDTLNQTVNLISNGFTAAQIDSGMLVAQVSFYEQSLDQGAPSDSGYVILTFRNSSNVTISSTTQLGGYSIGVWKEFKGGYAIPAGTRSIIYTMKFVLEQGTNIDTFIDDNRLAISSSSSLWQNATSTGNGWYSLSWFGLFNTASSPWIYHHTLGWLYPFGTSTDSIWFYDPQWDGTGGWWWTSSSLFPWVFSVTEGEWLYFDAMDSTPSARWFFTIGGQPSTH